MEVIVNNSKMTVPKECTVDKLLEIMNIKCLAAVWVNEVQVLRGDYFSARLNEGDNIKVIRVLAGG